MARPQPRFTEEEKNEINEALRVRRSTKKYQRLMVLKLKAEQQLKSYEIGKILGLHKETVNRTVSQYKKGGIEAICPSKQTSNRRYMTQEEEIKFLEPFNEKAESGQILEVSDIIEKFEKKIGHRVSVGTVYLMLRRNGWRKLMPRSKHPHKASNEAIAAYKKNV